MKFLLLMVLVSLSQMQSSVLLADQDTASESSLEELLASEESARDARGDCPKYTPPVPPGFWAPLSYCSNPPENLSCHKVGGRPGCPTYCACFPK